MITKYLTRDGKNISTTLYLNLTCDLETFFFVAKDDLLCVPYTDVHHELKSIKITRKNLLVCYTDRTTIFFFGNPGSEHIKNLQQYMPLPCLLWYSIWSWLVEKEKYFMAKNVLISMFFNFWRTPRPKIKNPASSEHAIHTGILSGAWWLKKIG